MPRFGDGDLGGALTVPTTAGEKEKVSCGIGHLTRVTKGQLEFSKSGELKILIQYFYELSIILTSLLVWSLRQPCHALC